MPALGYSGADLYIRKCGRRMCRACNNERRRRSRSRQKEAS